LDALAGVSAIGFIKGAYTHAIAYRAEQGVTETRIVSLGWYELGVGPSESAESHEFGYPRYVHWADGLVDDEPSEENPAPLDALIAESGSFVDSRLRDVKIGVPIYMERVPLNLLGEFISERGLEVASLRFAEAFPALDAEAENLGALALLELRTVLDVRRTRFGSPVEVLGVKLAAGIIQTWGLVLLAGVMTYFLIHLRVLQRRLALEELPGDAFWIALYPDRAAKIAYLATGSLLPIVAVIVSIWALSTGDTSLAWNPLLVGVPAVGVLSALVYRTSFEMWRGRPLPEASRSSQGESASENGA
jgi:hypothetical protein